MSTRFAVVVTGPNFRRSVRSEKEAPLSAALDAFVACSIGDPVIVDVSTIHESGQITVKIRSSLDEEFVVRVRHEIN